ncbi:MAG: LamG domain-containing protein, partial [Candidatus Micrarchaeota archaeon]|nr:LamG domain-containing protein [Candidatus Micrarchaeota archaeon]
AVVLGALFQLGVFSSSSFAPRASPGSCQVYRPNGPYSTSLINLEGVCNGQLPQYVGVFVGGANQYIATPDPMPTSAITLVAWVYMTSDPTNYPRIIGDIYNNGVTWYGYGMYIGQNSNNFDTEINAGGAFGQPGCGTLSLNAWHFVLMAYSSATGTLLCYVDGAVRGTSTLSGQITYASGHSYSTYIGSNPQVSTGAFPGSIADVQMYNASLSVPEANALYIEGIGGAPVTLQSLVGWWPLNGNANDYSGNNNNGVPSGVSYTSQWTSGYTPP